LEYRFSQADIEAFKERENIVRRDIEGNETSNSETAYTPPPPHKEKNTLEKPQDSETGHNDNETGTKKEAENFDPLKKEKELENKGADNEPRRDGTGQDAIIELLKETTGILKEQLGKKDKQIEALNERQRETNIILNSLQSRLVLLEKPKEKKAKPENTPEVGEQEEKGFFKKLFR